MLGIFDNRASAVPQHKLSMRSALFSLVGILFLVPWGFFILAFSSVIAYSIFEGPADSYTPSLMAAIMVVFTAIAWQAFKKLAQAIYIDKLLKKRLWNVKLSPDEAILPKKILAALSVGGEIVQLTTTEFEQQAFLIDERMIGDKLQPTMRFSGEPVLYDLYDMVFTRKDWQRSSFYAGSGVLAHYTVFRVKLRRTVPYLVFDSRQARGKHLQSVYSGSQKLSLDTNLDDYFETYSSRHYQIEALSFITPEVIEAMIGLRDCDIEFVEDNLFCYTSLPDEEELIDFRQRCLQLHAKVNDNLPRYKVQLQPAVPIAKRILKNPHRYLPSVIFHGLLFAGLLIADAVWADENSKLLPLMATAFILFANECRKMFAIVKLNHRVKSDLKLYSSLRNRNESGQGITTQI